MVCDIFTYAMLCHYDVISQQQIIALPRVTVRLTRSRTIDLSNNVRHARLVAKERRQVNWL